MRVLLDCSNLVRGGALQVALGIIQQACRTTEISWHVIVSPELGEQVLPEADSSLDTLVRLPNLPRVILRLYAISELQSLVRSCRPNIAFTVFGPTLWKPRVPQLLGFANPRMIYPEYEDTAAKSSFSQIKEAIFAPMRRHALRKSDYLVVESETVKNRTASIFQYPRARIFVIRNSYSSIFLEAMRSEKVKRDPSCFTIIVPSSYYRHKNLEIIPRVAAELSNVITRRFQFVFTLPEESMEWACITMDANRLGVENTIRTVGKVPHASFCALYHTADAVFLPTLLECSTAVYPEAFIAEVPLCTSDRDFSRELCGNAALYVDPTSPVDCAKGLRRLMSDGDLCLSLVRSGREVLKERYPTPAQKWADQLRCLRHIANSNK